MTNHGEWTAHKAKVEELRIFHYIPHPEDIMLALLDQDPELSKRVKVKDLKEIVLTTLDLAHQLALRDMAKRSAERSREAWDDGVFDIKVDAAIRKIERGLDQATKDRIKRELDEILANANGKV